MRLCSMPRVALLAALLALTTLILSVPIVLYLKVAGELPPVSGTPNNSARQATKRAWLFTCLSVVVAVTTLATFVLRAELAQETGVAFGWLPAVVATLAAAALWHRAKQHLALARSLNALGLGKEDYVLYLRSFDRDTAAWKHSVRAAIRLNPFRPTREEQLARAVRPIGTLVSVRNPTAALPTPGGLATHLDNDAWKAQVSRLIEQARLVVLDSGNTQGLVWEVGQCRARLPPNKLVIWLSRVDRFDYSMFSKVFAQAFSQRLPAFSRPFAESGLVLFNADWSFVPRALRAPFWRRPTSFVGAAQQADLRHGLAPIFTLLGVRWSPHPISASKMLFVLLGGAVIAMAISANYRK